VILAAWFWFIAWSLWWLIAHLGAQGTTPVMALIGLLALPFLFWKRPRPSADVLAFAAFMEGKKKERKQKEINKNNGRIQGKED